MRLIDADALLEDAIQEFEKLDLDTLELEERVGMTTGLLALKMFVDRQPTVEVGELDNA